MNCREFRKRMIDLLTEEISQQDASELREHASACAECALELEESLRAIESLAPSPQLAASPRLKEKTMKQILQLQSNPASAQPIAQEVRSRRRGPSWAYALGAAALIIAIVTVTLFSNPSSGFAQVIDRLARSRSLAIIGTVTVSDSDPFAMAIRSIGDQKSRIDIGSSTTMIIDRAQSKAVSLSHPDKKYLSIDLSDIAGATSDDANPFAKSDSAAATTGDANQDPFARMDFVERLRKLTASAGKPAGSKVENGRNLQAFKASDGNTDYLIWADKQSGEIVRAEYESRTLQNARGEITEMRYDDEIDEKLFDLAPPPDYQPMLPEGAKASLPSEEKFISFLRDYAAASEGHLFPDDLDMTRLTRELMTASDFRNLPKDERIERIRSITSGMTFPITMTPNQEFHYAGKGVPLGYAQTPIAWYKPRNATEFRVIYGDLTVRDVPRDQLPPH